MNFPPKAVSILLLVQCLFIGMGYALSRKMIRLLEASELYDLAGHMPVCATFVLNLGVWAFLIPLSWALWVSLRSESHRRIPMTQSNDAKMTLVLTFVIVCVWSYAAVQSMDVALGFHGPLTEANLRG